MSQQDTKPASSLLVVIAFATVYIVWGSTYYYIQQGLKGFPPLLLGALRYSGAAFILLLWCLIKREKIFVLKDMKNAAVVGILLLFIGNGGVIWAEQTIPSAMAAIMVSSAPLWFVILDKNKWADNFRNKATIIGLLIGFIGVILLFSEPLQHAFSAIGNFNEIGGLIMLTVAVIAWTSGSLFSKHNPPTRISGIVSTMWQMLFGALAFFPGIFIRKELNMVNWNNIPGDAWFAVFYLIIMGSIGAYSAYVWLLQVRPATQVSTYAYVNPIVAVLFGVILANEKITFYQGLGLAIILGSVVLINLSNYIKKKPLLKPR
ncbi:MAG: EamA family transporter [Chitinophagaceae bacterium]|nr:EamA family transporter [Chitinophagaceae bacterium]